MGCAVIAAKHQMFFANERGVVEKLNVRTQISYLLFANMRAEKAELAARDKYRQTVDNRNRIKHETALGIRNQAFRMVCLFLS